MSNLPPGQTSAGIRFDVATPADRGVLRDINTEYIAWVLDNVEREFGHSLETILGMPLARYVEKNIETLWSYRPPRGVFYLIRAGDDVAGMGGLRPLPDGACELKRIYVREQFRGRNLGTLLFERLLDDARGFGYATARLDTSSFMKSAMRMYAEHGFVERDAYAGVEISDLVHGRWKFMERSLG